MYNDSRIKEIMKNKRDSARRKLICIRCENEFSTYSSNRQLCHKCLPKCREKHYFYNVPDKKKTGKKEQKVEQY